MEVYSVWVGGVEINDFMLDKQDALELARFFQLKGYDDVVIENTESLDWEYHCEVCSVGNKRKTKTRLAGNKRKARKS